jgi:hypothetical protein
MGEGGMYADDAERKRIAKLKGWDYLGLGIIGQIAGLLVVHSPEDLASPIGIAGQVILILFTGVLVGGCAKYAKFYRMGKGWALLGLFNFPGVLMLVVIAGLRSLSKHGKGAGFSVIFAEPYKRDVWRMDVKVKLDETVGARVNEPINLQLARGSNVGTAMKTLAGVIPGLNDGELPNGEYLINGQEADRRMELSDGDELVVRVIAPTDRDLGGSGQISGW